VHVECVVVGPLLNQYDSVAGLVQGVELTPGFGVDVIRNGREDVDDGLLLTFLRRDANDKDGHFLPPLFLVAPRWPYHLQSPSRLLLQDSENDRLFVVQPRVDNHRKGSLDIGPRVDRKSDTGDETSL